MKTVQKEKPDSTLPPVLPVDYGGVRELKKDGTVDWSKVEDLDPKISVYAVQALRIFARKTISARRMSVEAKGKPDFNEKLSAFVAAKTDLDDIIKQGGMPLEKAHRKYLGFERLHKRFRRLRGEAVALDKRVEEVSEGVLTDVEESIAGRRGMGDADGSARRESARDGAVVPESEVRAPDARAELARRQKSLVHEPVDLTKVTKAEMAFVFGDDAEAAEALKSVKDEGNSPKEFKDLLKSSDISLLRRERDARLAESERLWRDPTVQYLEQIAMVKDFVTALEQGEEVLEIPYTVSKLNELAEIEANNPDSTIGAVCVGEPGTGKTTAIRYYLAKNGRSFAYMDLSKEVTRFQYLGSKEITMGNPLKDLKDLLDSVDGLKDDDVEAVMRKGVGKYGAGFAALVDEASSADGDVKGKEKLKRVLQNRMADVMADEIFKAGKKNGWRYGFAMDCLRKNICPIFDEFNKAQNLDPIFGLMTAQPASDKEAGPMPGTTEAEIKANPRGWYYFADNNEWLRVPKNWRMYFSGNIGSIHQVFAIPPALRSRMEGKVVHFDYPPKDQEMLIAHSMLCDPDLEFRAPYGVAEGLRILISEVFPKVRTEISGAQRPHPISLRTLNGICTQLYDRHSETSKCDSIADLDRAIIHTMLNIYKLQEKRDVPRTITEYLTQVGLLLSPEVEDEVASWMCDNPQDAQQTAEAKKNLQEKRADHDKAGTFKKLHDTSRFSVQSALKGPPGLMAP